MPFIPAHYDDPDPRMHWDNPNLFWDLGLWVEGSPMPDAIIKIDVDKLTDQELIDRAHLHKDGLAGNAAIFTDGTFLTAVTAALSNAETKLGAQSTAQQAAKVATSEKNSAITALRKQMKLGGKYVDTKANGDATIMTKGGFGPRAAGAPPAIVAPSGLNATYGDVSGSMSLHWNPTPGAVTYVAQYRVANSNGAWQNSAPVTASAMQLTGLTPGELYEVRVCAVFAGQSQPGPACDTVEHRAA